MGELALLRTIRKRAEGPRNANVHLGIGDDCAILRLGDGEELAVTTDLSIAGRHFRMDWHPPEAVGHRTLARGLSDLAAMGARPVAVFLSLGLPSELTTAASRKDAWVDRFFHGFYALAEAHKALLAGGDLAQSPIALADIVCVGAVPRGKALLRSGARPGDRLYVTGSLGGAAAGLLKLAELARAHDPSVGALKIPARWRKLLSPHLYPAPRIPQGLVLQRRGLPTAAIDVSDGLSTDLAHLCEESSVHAVVEAAALPIAAGASLQQALHGGEDYELLFTARPATRIPSAIAGVPLTQIGKITRPVRGQAPVTLATTQGLQRLVPQGWQHFTER